MQQHPEQDLEPTHAASAAREEEPVAAEASGQTEPSASSSSASASASSITASAETAKEAEPRVSARPKAKAGGRARGQEAGRVNLDPESTRNGVAQLVLALVKFLHELLERQAVRRMDAGTLTDEQIERLGVALMKQGEQLERMRKEFGLEEEDLNLDLGPLGKLV